MKKVLQKTVVVLFSLCLLVLFACGKQDDSNAVKADENTVVIRPSEEVLVIGEDTTLSAYLNAMQEDGLIEFTAESGMIVSVNGIANEYTSANAMKCWMIYTSDPALSNKAFGQLAYEGKTYGSASYGADGLIIKAEYVYFLAYHEVTW